MTQSELNEVRSEKKFFGHPQGLAVLFGTEMWERFSFYGLSGILVLFLGADIASNGLGMDTADAVAVSSIYSGLVYLTSLPGGWLADRVFGARKSVFIGGVIIMFGHISMAVPVSSGVFIFLGLALIVAGSGMLKPNISTMVGKLYDGEGTSRRDAGFSIFYMGINLGAFLGQTVTPFLAGDTRWHLGFSAAAIGMAVGLIWYWLGWNKLENAGTAPTRPLSSEEKSKYGRLVGIVVAVVAALFGLWVASGTFDPSWLPNIITFAALAIAVWYFVTIFRQAGDVSASERSGMYTYIGLFLASVVFWMLYFQIFSSVMVFVDESVDRVLFGLELPAGVVTNMSTIFILAFSPVFAALWVKLGSGFTAVRKFTAALFLIAVPYLVLGWLKGGITDGETIGLAWMVLVFLLIVWGELSLSPVGLSVTQQLAPQKLQGQMMGLWYLSLAVGSPLGGLLYGWMEPRFGEVGFFYALGFCALIAGAALAVMTPKLERLMR
ncbi:peptide MFS transporter [Haloglycomyces albus]|uniref:peptide MFS transporter n=1 Tax=Haloglycomyces albus TaxID=526067 RepID=UPI0004B285D1|nr:peptide MFS transporter [Haloglycomyces albus]